MICLDIQKKASNGYVPEKESEVILRMDTNLKASISSEYGKLSNWEKSRVVKHLRLLGKNNFDVITYCQIDGVDLNGLEHAFQGEGSDGELGYLHLLVDAITLSKEKNKGLPVSMCLSDDVEVAEVLGHKGSECVGIDGAIGAWGIEVEKGTKEKYNGADDNCEDHKKEDEERKKREDEDRKRREAEAKAEERKKEEEKSKHRDEYDNLREEIRKIFNLSITQNVEGILERYRLLLESGYDLERPYGIVSSFGVIYLDSDNVLKVREDYEHDIDINSSLNMYNYFEGKLNFEESDSRSAKMIGADMLEGYRMHKTIYFPNKLLEYAYGRASSREESKNYSYAKRNGEGISTKWGKMRDMIREDLKIVIENSLVVYCVNILGCDKSGKDAREKIVKSGKNSEVEGFIKYISNSMSNCVIIMEYKSTQSKPLKMRIRVCDPSGSCYQNMTGEIINVAFSGNTGGSEGVTLSSSLNEVDSNTYKVYEYAHEFNHVLSNAMPLFAYKAYEKLAEKGESISFKDLVLGQSIDGTILRNGTHGVNLSGNLFHYINAGSRSGKGVMTLNMVAGALLSGKALFYLDNKPDMASMLSEIGGGNTASGPSFFALNGSNYNDDKQAQFTMQDSWINPEHIPVEVVELFGEPSWSKLGDLFYMRAYTLAFGIILARGLDGGHGKGDDERFGGKQGIFLICDETNILQDKFRLLMEVVADKIPLQSKNFKSMSAALIAKYNEMNTEGARKGIEAKYDTMRRDFEEAFNAHKFYALSLLNMFADNISYLGDKSNAGFLRAEFEKSDVAVIGQNLEQRPISKETIRTSVSSARLTGEASGAKGLGGTQVAKDVKGSASIPLAHFVFSSSDALIGYNSIHPEYLAQTEAGSNAFGRLDLSANNFCYLPRLNLVEDEKPAVQLTKSKANEQSSVYFKPYLILNNSSDAYTSQMFERVANAGLLPEDVIREYPDENNSGKISPFVGFPEYMSLMGVTDIADRLKKSAEIANFVVGQVLGYPDDGSGRPLWLQLVTDLRPEWIFSLKDVACLSGGLTRDANLPKEKNNPLVKEYYDYIKFVTENTDLGITDNSMSREGVMYVDDNGDVNWDLTGYERDGGTGDFDADDEYDENGYVSRMQRGLGDDEVYDDDEEIDDFFGDDTDYHDGFETADVFDASSNVVGSREGYAYEMAEKDRQIAELLQKLKEAGYSDKDLEGYGVFSSGSTGQGVDCGYRVPEDRYEFGRTDFDGMGEGFASTDDEIRATTMAHLIQKITDRVLVDFGGPERFKSIRVIGGALIVNGTAYRCKVSKDCIGLLPLDIRRKVHAGNIADLFNWSALYRMPNLRGLEFDSINFVSTEVASMLGFGSNISVESFFVAFPSLLGLILGKNRFTRQNYKQEMQDCDLFYYQSRGTAYAGACDSVLSKWTKNSWTFTKNMLTDRNKGVFTRVLGVMFGGAASAVTGVAALGAKGAKGIGQMVDKKKNKGRIGKGIDVVKETFKDLF